MEPMENFGLEDLNLLISKENDACISIYLPTDPAAAVTDEQRIGFKNLLRTAENEARRRWPKNRAILERLAEGRRLLENDFFWRHQGHGLAVFVTPAEFRFYRLPIRFKEAVSVSTRFAVTPLVPLFTSDGRFHILALSQSEAGLFACTRHSLSRIDLAGLPGGLDETLGYDSKQPQLQFHAAEAEGDRDRAAIFHGHGVGIDDHKDEIRRYLRAVAESVAASLTPKDLRETPLVLAGDDYLMAAYREVSDHGRILTDGISGNPDEAPPEALHRKALAVVGPELEKGRREAGERYRELAGKGFTAAGVRSVVPAAVYGKVDTLFVILGERRPGGFDRDKNVVLVGGGNDAGDTDLLELAAVETLRNGGRVYALDRDEMPENDTAAAAILRY